MRKCVKLFLLIYTCNLILFGQTDNSSKIYDDESVARIDISIDEDALTWIYDNVNSDSMHNATVHFKNSQIDEVVDNIGFRLRGNTSRNAVKKSFKISFNEFENGRKFYGIDKLNLNGEHNDPSIIRSKLCWDLYRMLGIKAPRASYAEVYINGDYYGLYINVENIDSDMLKKRFENFDGNLWKCLYPADLTYLGSDPNLYKFVQEGRRAYDLKTNEDEDDYSKLAQLINVINNSSSSELPIKLEDIFDVASFLKYKAFNFLTGNWDDYHSLMNNYYLYHDPVKEYFTFIPFDYDNNFGIDWFNIDWADTNPYNIPKVVSGSRPLSEKLQQISEYRNLYTHFIEFFSNNVINVSSVGSRIDSIKSLIKPSAENDLFRTYDYNFSMNDFDLSYISGSYSNQHVKYGLKQFINKKNSTIYGKINYMNAKPIVYKINVEDQTPNAIDTIEITAAVFSHSPLEEVDIVFYDEVSFEEKIYPMFYSPIADTKIVEENDRWVGTIPPLGENGKGYFKIRVKNQNQLTENYPRLNPIKIKVNSSGNTLLFINEIMADNDNVNQDEAGEFDDWLEIYNSSADEIDLSSYYLSDKKDNLTKWQFPAEVKISPFSYLLVWCDEDSEQGQLHTNFKLSASGEFIALTAPDGLTVIDSISFGEQTADLSFSRIPDGSINWQISNPTPGTTNLYVDSVEDDITLQSFELGAYPNPFNPSTKIRFSLPAKNGLKNVSLKIYDVLGNEITELINNDLQPGTYEVTLNGSSFSSGVYLCRLTAGSSVKTQKLMLVK